MVGVSKTGAVVSRPLKLIPSDISQAWTIARYELLRYVRRKRFLGVLIIVAIIVLLILAVPPVVGISYPSDPYQFSQIFANFTAILILICATFFASDSLVSEFQHKTGYLLFPNPVKKMTTFFGKFLASAIACLSFVSLYYLALVMSCVAITRQLPLELPLSYLFALLYTVSAVGVAFFISSLMKGTTGSAILTFFLFLLILPILQGVLSIARIKPHFSITFAGLVSQYILSGPYPEVYPQDKLIETPEGFGYMMYFPDVLISLAVLPLYFLISISLAALIFKRREMLG